VQTDLSGGPVRHGGAGEFGSVVATQHRRISATLTGQTVELGDEVLAGDPALDHSAEAFAGVLVDDGHDLDRFPVGGGIELEVHCPHLVGRIRARGVVRGGGAAAFAASPCGNAEPLLAPKALDLLVIDEPTLAARVMVGRPEPAARVVTGVGAQPGPQRRIRVGRRRRHGLAPLSGAVLPGDAASEPLANPQHPLEMTNCRPPAFRA